MTDCIISARKLSFARVFAALLLPMMLVACSGDEEAEQQKALYESYSLVDLQAFVEAGEAQKALDALHYYRDEGTASDGHMLLLAKLYVGLGDGLAGEETIIKLLARGFEAEKTALTLAQSLVLQGKYDDADEAFQNKILPEEDVFDALILRGDIMHSTENYARAEGFYKAAIEADPESHLGYTAAALFYLQQGDYVQAESFADEALVRETEDPMVHYAQGMVSRYAGELDEARDFFLQSVEGQQSGLLSRLELTGIYLAQDNFEAAQKQLDLIYGEAPNNPMAMYYTSLLLVRSGKFDEAEDLLVRTGDFTRLYPMAAQVYGLATYELGKYSVAIPFLRRSINSFPNDVPTRLALADSMAKIGQTSGALEVLKPLADAGNNITALIHATSAAIGTGDMRTARRYIEKALELAEKDGAPGVETINALKKRAAFARFLDNDLEGATALLDAMYASGTRDTESLMSKANMLLTAGRLDQASAVLDELLLVDPESAAVANLQGAVLHRQQKYQQAIEAYSAAIDKVPAYQSALKNRAFTYIILEDYPSARADLDILSEYSSEDPQVAAMYGRALLETGDAEAAIPFLEKAIEALPGEAIVVADHAEAVAALGLYTRAINIAYEAKRVGARSTGLVAYLDEKIAEWQAAKAEIETEEQAIRDTRDEKALAQQAKDIQRREALRKESGNITDTSDDQSALDELKKLAEENRKLRIAEEEKAKAAILKENQDILADDQPSKVPDPTRIRRNQLFGIWLAGEIGLTGNAAVDYAQSVVLADDSEIGDTDLIRKALQDLEAAGKIVTSQSIEAVLAEKMKEARASLEKPD